jgi:hypothetical protein
MQKLTYLPTLIDVTVITKKLTSNNEISSAILQMTIKLKSQISQASLWQVLVISELCA